MLGKTAIKARLFRRAVEKGASERAKFPKR